MSSGMPRAFSWGIRCVVSIDALQYHRAVFMNILQINTEKTWRGGEKQTLLTAKALQELGHKVVILCRKGHPLACKAQAQHIQCREVAGSLQAMVFLALYGASFDILHVQTAKAQSCAVLTKPFHRTRIVYTRRVNFRPRGWPARFKFRYTDKVVAISQAIAQVLHDFGITTEAVIPSALDLTVPSPSPPQGLYDQINRHKQAGKTIILTIAALAPSKDPDTLLKAIQHLHLEDPNIMCFHCGSGELEAEIRKVINDTSMQEYYHLLGFVDNAEGLLPLADVFVMSSQEEGLGSTVLEAFRHKIPVVSTDAGGLKEIVPGHGLISPIHDAQALATQIHHLLTNPQLAQSLVRKAWEYVQDHHSHLNMASAYLPLFASLMQDNKQPPGR